MMRWLVDPALPQWKGNFHCHSTESDGRLPPDEVVKKYRDAGYDFLAITDHRKITRLPQTQEKPLLIPGIELDYIIFRRHRQAVHIVGVGPEKDVMAFPGVMDTPQKGIDCILAAGGRAIFAHPAWSLNDPEVIEEMRGLSAVEVYNHMSDDPWNGRRGDSSQVLDLCCADGCCLPFVAGDDAHEYNGDECHSALIVSAGELTRSAVLDALDRGRVYASQGPRILAMGIQDDELILRCTEAEQIIFNSNLLYRRDRVLRGRGLTEARFPLRETESFIRVEITDAAGGRAWSSPVPLR